MLSVEARHKKRFNSKRIYHTLSLKRSVAESSDQIATENRIVTDLLQDFPNEIKAFPERALSGKLGKVV